mgnify:CR=1 FL=1
MLGIQQMFSEFSAPDDFEAQAQLELFMWARNRQHRESQRTYAEKVKADTAKLEARRARQRRYWNGAPRVIVNSAEKREAHRLRMQQGRAEKAAEMVQVALAAWRAA